MLRRSLAAAAASARNPAKYTHPGCSHCSPLVGSIAVAGPSSSKGFSSSAIAARGQDSGYTQRSRRDDFGPNSAPRWGARSNDNDQGFRKHGGSNNKSYGGQDRRGKGGNRGGFGKGNFQGRPRGQVKDVDFSAPEPPTAQEVGRKLVDKLSAMSKDPDLPTQLVAYGIKGTPANLLLQHYLGDASGRKHKAGESSTKAATLQNDSSMAIKLFRTWSEEVRDTILDLALLHDKGKSAHADIFAHLPDAVASYTIEGEECLGRFCVSAFLD